MTLEKIAARKKVEEVLNCCRTRAKKAAAQIRCFETKKHQREDVTSNLDDHRR